MRVTLAEPRMEDRKLPEDAIELLLGRVDPEVIIALVHEYCPEWSVEEITQRVMEMLRNQVPDGS